MRAPAEARAAGHGAPRRARRGRAWSFAGALLGFSCALLGVAAIGCTSNESAARDRLRIPDGGLTPIGDAGEGGAGAAPPGTDAGATDAGLARVLFGIAANPPGDDPPPGDATAAVLATFAAGARAVVLTRAWRDLDAGAQAELAAEADLYAAHGQAIVFNLAIVDRASDERPVALASAAWDTAAARAAVEASIDLVLAAFGPALRDLTFGRDADVYLAAHPAERAAFSTLAAHACAYARDKGGEGLGVGVAFSYAGATAPDPSFAELLHAGNVAVLSLLPGLSGRGDESEGDVAAALDALAAAAAERPIVLQAFGASSAEAAGSSPDQQALFYDTFFDALAPRRGVFELVNAYELHDLGPATCAALVEAQGEPPDGPFAARACSLGMFAADGAPKPAWTSILRGAATFASP